MKRSPWFNEDQNDDSTCGGTVKPKPKENPKHIAALKADKPPLEFLVSALDEAEARVLASGAFKYGVRNWRIDKILASTYEGAIRRHFEAWRRGEDLDPDSGQPHLAHIRATCAILADAEAHGTLIDDRARAESIDQETTK